MLWCCAPVTAEDELNKLFLDEMFKVLLAERLGGVSGRKDVFIGFQKLLHAEVKILENRMR